MEHRLQPAEFNGAPASAGRGSMEPRLQPVEFNGAPASAGRGSMEHRLQPVESMEAPGFSRRNQDRLKPVLQKNRCLDRRDVRGLESFRTLDQIELDRCAFGQSAEAFGLDRAEMDEHVLSALGRDEAITFRVVEPLHGTGITHFAENLLWETPTFRSIS